MDGTVLAFDPGDQDLHTALGHHLGRLNHTAQLGHQIGSNFQTVKTDNGYILGYLQTFFMEGPDGTYSHNIEYLIKDSADIDTIFESAINAFIKNKGCTLKIN